jgi:FkbM family methyltransferase
MLFKLGDLSQIFNLPSMGVLHVGAHEAEEFDFYDALGWGPITWVEAQPSLVLKLRNRLDSKKNRVIEAAVWDESGVELKFKISSNSQSSSLLDLGTHSDDYPLITYVEEIRVSTKRLDDLLTPSDLFEFINLDLQGAEGRALVGLGNLLSKTNFVYTEVNKQEVYVGCTLIKDLDVFLENHGFSRVATRWVPFKGWGDAFYVRKSELKVRKSQYVKLVILQSQYFFSEYLRAILVGVYFRLKKLRGFFVSS